MRALAIMLVSTVPGIMHADALTPVRAIRPSEVIEPGDVIFSDLGVPGALNDVAAVIGMEARITLYPGRPIRPGDIGPPAIVERNQPVELIYARGVIRISTEGRALARGAAGDWVRVMNLSSRTTVSGRVLETGQVLVGPSATH